MPEIDIPVKVDLQSALDLPACEVLRIPLPAPVKITLPTGGSLQAFTDMSKGIPNDCSMSFNLLVQVSPLLAAIECPLKILKVLGPLLKVITGLTKVPPEPPTPALAAQLADAAADLAPCLLIPTPASILPFVKDILCLIRSVLNCLVSQLRSVRDLMQGLQLRFAAAEGNDDLLATLDCAQENAGASVQNLTQAIEPLSALMGILASLMELAQLPPIELPSVSAPPEDIEAISALIDTLQGVVDAIDTVTGGICA